MPEKSERNQIGGSTSDSPTTSAKGYWSPRFGQILAKRQAELFELRISGGFGIRFGIVTSNGFELGGRGSYLELGKFILYALPLYNNPLFSFVK
ncbi:hypothetical protein AVEN_5745-1 [Araneus ventricosus]|uniref:Uncharacterized protein n=1 Tax=Araneus ventricosus TaxID=182803 RepID=A0A4Y2DYD5_ARAVE|nr:hypothetical protein AVEN_5745-1 [Araneus ventricosus]